MSEEEGTEQTAEEQLAEEQLKAQAAAPPAPQQMGVEQVLQQAQQAESMGIPVDWKAMSIKVFNSANQTVLQLQTQVADLEAHIESLPKLEDPAE